MTARAPWDDFFLAVAVLAATRSTCPRRRVGAVLVQDHRLRGIGYNGAPAGVDHCVDAGCQMSPDGNCLRARHAEVNLILQSDEHERIDATLYCTDEPCVRCATMLCDSGIRRVVYARGYEPHHEMTTGLLRAKGIACEQLPLPGDPEVFLQLPASVAALTGASR